MTGREGTTERQAVIKEGIEQWDAEQATLQTRSHYVNQVLAESGLDGLQSGELDAAIAGGLGD